MPKQTTKKEIEMKIFQEFFKEFGIMLSLDVRGYKSYTLFYEAKMSGKWGFVGLKKEDWIEAFKKPKLLKFYVDGIHSVCGVRPCFDYVRFKRFCQIQAKWLKENL